MPNMTMTVDEDVLKKARKIAIEKNTTLSALVRTYLEHLAEREDQSTETIIKELQAGYHSKDVIVGKKTWKRGDLHER